MLLVILSSTECELIKGLKFLWEIYTVGMLLAYLWLMNQSDAHNEVDIAKSSTVVAFLDSSISDLLRLISIPGRFDK